MSVFQKIFGNGPTPQRTEANPAANPNAQPPANQLPSNNPNQIQPSINSVTSQGTAPNGVVPNNVPESPLDKHSKLWDDAPVDPNAPQNNNIFNVKPEDVMTAAEKNDFLKSIVTKEDLEKMQAGGPEAVALSLQLMNKMGQKVYGQSAITTSQIIEKALEKQRERFEAALPAIIRQHSVGENLMQENPAFANPAVAPLVEIMKAQIAAKHPDATSKQLESMAKEYISSVGAVFNPASQNQNQNTGRKGGGPRAVEEYDFSKFLEG